MRLKPTKGLMACLAGFLALMILATTGIVMWQNGLLATTREQVKARTEEVRDGQARELRREQALDSLEKDRERLRFLESGVSDSAYVPTLLKQLEELAVQTHNRVLGVQPQMTVQAPNRLQQRRDPDAQAKEEGKGGEGGEKPKPPEPYTPLGIQVSLVGGYQSSQAFVEKLTQFPKIVAVEEMQIRPHHAGTEEKGQQNLLDIEMKLTAYVMKEKAPSRSAVTASAGSPGGVTP